MLEADAIATNGHGGQNVRPLTALLFPGQGSQQPGMRETVERLRPDLLEQVIHEVGSDPFERMDDGTAFVQPAIFCASIAGLSLFEDVDADVMAGHSLGEIAALVAAGSLSEEDGLRLVTVRGRVMQDAAEAHPRPGGMLAVIGGNRHDVAPLAERHGVTLANENSPTQTVLSGDADRLDAAAAEAKASGLRAVRLPVRGSFHSPAMEPAVPRFAAALAGVDFRPPRVPVFSSLTARPLEDVRRRLADSLTHPVRWVETLAAMQAYGVGRYVEVGPGKVLTGLVRRTLDGVEAVAAPPLPETARA